MIDATSQKKLMITPDVLKKILRYDAQTGQLYWLERGSEFSSPNRTPAAWNAKFAGKQAFTAISRGYYVGNIFQCTFAAHRVAWAMHYGQWPQQQIDHINGDRADNRIENLRDVTHFQNLRNMKRSKRNTSGCTGVYWSKQKKKWHARVMSDRKTKHLGFFENIEDAYKARNVANSIYGFSERHGVEASQ